MWFTMQNTWLKQFRVKVPVESLLTANMILMLAVSMLAAGSFCLYFQMMAADMRLSVG